MPLNQAQQAAVDYLEGPLLVLAGPGTGKTQLLSAKVAHILEVTDANPENILCLTFTDAGAQNMRDRLATMIGPAANDVNIYTYHAFGKNLLDRYQNYTETPERQLDNSIDQTTQYKIIATLRDRLPVTDILKTAAVKDIISTIASAKAARLTASDLERIAKQNISDSLAISEAISPLLEAIPPRAKFDLAVTEHYKPILDLLTDFRQEQPIVGSIYPLANALSDELGRVILDASAADKPSVKPLTAWRNKIFEKTDTGAYRLKDHIANKKLLSLAQLMASYETQLQANGLFDFSDMIELAIHYLKTDTGFRLSLSELFQYILLDEFQDTNPSQFELIKLLTAYEQPAIMAVGDDDQAIYEFQGANASNLMDFREHYQAKVISLTVNYRSTGEVLTTSRQVAAQIADSFIKKYPDITKELSSHHDLTEGAAKVSGLSRHEFPCAELEYTWVANQIKNLVASGEEPSDIAILAAKHKNLVAILPYLKVANLDIAYEKRENLLQDEQMKMLITLAQFIHELSLGHQPSSQLLEILSYDFWGLPLLDVMQLFSERYSHKNTLEFLSASTTASAAMFTTLAQFFAHLAAKALTAPLELWFDYLIGAAELDGFTSPFLSYYERQLSQPALLEFYENLQTLRQSTQKHLSSLGNADFTPKLADFVATINDYDIAGTEILRISNFRDSKNAIQVMTAYKSKGLEFKHVFLTAVDDLSWGKSKGNNNLLSLPRNVIQIRHTGISDDEKLRLLFVAMTRAKRTLTLTSSSQDADGKAVSRLTYLNESSPEAATPISPFLPAAAQNIRLHSDDTSVAEKITALRLGWVSHYQTPAPQLDELMRARVENYRLSASDLTNFLNIIYAGPEAIYRQVILHEPPSPSTPEQAYGTLVHHVFEQVTNQKLDSAAALAEFKSAARQLPFEPETIDELIASRIDCVKTALSEFAPILQDANAKAEVNLAAEHLNFAGIPIAGKIDHLAIDPKAKTIEVYDFKTGGYHPEKWSSHPTLFMYCLQLNFYKLLLALSPTYSKYKVTRGHILFVTPDSDGKVYDKVYEYTEQDMTELQALIKAVYHSITSLDFVKNPEIFIPANKSYNLSKIRQFIEKLLATYSEPINLPGHKNLAICTK